MFAGFALATVVGLPVGSLVGQAYGWHATFVLVAALGGIGLVGVLVFCPRIPAVDTGGLGGAVRVVANRPVLTGLAVTLLTLTGFVAVFTYVAPMLTTVSGFSPGWVSVALVGYGLGTVAGNVLAGRVPPAAIPRVLPVPLAVLALVLLAQGVLLRNQPAALVGPRRARRGHVRRGPAPADVAHGAGRAVGGRAGRGGEHLGRGDRGRARRGSRRRRARRGLGLVAIGPIAALPVLGAAGRRGRPPQMLGPGVVSALRMSPCGATVNGSTDREEAAR